MSWAQIYSWSRSRVFDRWPSAGFHLDRGLVSGWKQGRIVQKAVNANPELKVNRIVTFFNADAFTALFCVCGDYWNPKQKAKQYTENLTSKLLQ